MKGSNRLLLHVAIANCLKASHWGHRSIRRLDEGANFRVRLTWYFTRNNRRRSWNTSKSNFSMKPFRIWKTSTIGFNAFYKSTVAKDWSSCPTSSSTSLTMAKSSLSGRDKLKHLLHAVIVRAFQNKDREKLESLVRFLTEEEKEVWQFIQLRIAWTTKFNCCERSLFDSFVLLAYTIGLCFPG